MNGLIKVILGIVIGVILVGIIGVVAVIGLGAAAVKSVANTKPADVTSAAAKIADLTLPEGYTEDYAVSLGGITVAAYKPGDGHSHLVLAQGPKGLALDQSQLDGALRKSQPGYQDRTTRMTVVEQRPVTIRGQATTLLISEGTNSEGIAYRQLSAAFQGKGGPALLVLDEPVSRWSAERVDKLISSIQ